MQIDWAIAIAGLGVGFIVGLTGMGGGALMTPVLVLFFGVDPTNAVGSDLLASLIMKPIGGSVHLRRGTVNRPLVMWLMLGSVPSAFFSVWLLHFLADPKSLNDIVQVSIGVALVLASIGLAMKGAFSGKRRDTGDITHVAVKPLPTLLIGVFGGVMVGLTSVGSGSLMMTLLLILYPTLVARHLVGTDLIQAIPLVGAAALAHLLFAHDIKLDLTGSLLVGALPGVFLGAHVSSRAADHIIRPILAVVLVISGLKMLKVDTMWVGIIGLILTAIAIVFIVRHRERGERGEGEAQGDDQESGSTNPSGLSLTRWAAARSK